jgi:hypothetical protein
MTYPISMQLIYWTNKLCAEVSTQYGTFPNNCTTGGSWCNTNVVCSKGSSNITSALKSLSLSSLQVVCVLNVYFKEENKDLTPTLLVILLKTVNNAWQTDGFFYVYTHQLLSISLVISLTV